MQEAFRRGVTLDFSDQDEIESFLVLNTQAQFEDWLAEKGIDYSDDAHYIIQVSGGTLERPCKSFDEVKSVIMKRSGKLN